MEELAPRIFMTGILFGGPSLVLFNIIDDVNPTQEAVIGTIFWVSVAAVFAGALMGIWGNYFE